MPHLRWLTLSTLFAGLCGSLYAVDGVVLIDQNRALAGNVTPGDTPGFPVTISLPGSYRLTGNLTVPDANTNGIVITADHVTIDFNGFSILGPVVCTGSPTVTSCSPLGTGNGVNSSANYITVMNGGIHGMGSVAVSLSSAIGGQRVERMLIDSNGNTGINVVDGTVVNNIANYNGFSGINIIRSTVTGNTALGNQVNGISATCPSAIIGNTAVNNGFNIFTSGAGCVVANNAAP